jgi:uncharacterized protein YycO
LFKKNWHDHLPGGLADNKKPNDFDAKALAQGKAVEGEHTSRPEIAQEIAMDHLTEDPHYYTKLQKMEGEHEKQAGLGDFLRVPIPGTKDWVINTGKRPLQGMATMAKGKATSVPPFRPSGVSPAMKAPGTRTMSGVTQISEDELRRLGFGDLTKSGALVTDDLKNFESRLKPGDILLTRAVHPTLMSRVVSAVQHSEFGHSSIYAGDGKVIDTRVDKGVFTTTLPEVYKKWGGGREIRAYRPKVDASARGEAIEKAKDFVGTPYDLKGALRLLLPAGANKGLDEAKKKAVICSQVVVRAYPHLNFAAGKDRDHVLPADIAKSPLTARVAELRQKLAFQLQGHTTVQGLPIAIENRKGSVRKGVDEDGKPWKTVFKIPYGYITGTEGNDGEEIDVYVGADKKAPNAFVVHQRKLESGKYDEDKLFLGMPSEEATREAYLDHYNGVGRKLLGPITTITVDELKRRLKEKQGKIRKIQ